MGRKALGNREEVRKNQIVVPMTAAERDRIMEAAKRDDRSMSSFVRMVLNEHFKKEGMQC